MPKKLKIIDSDDYYSESDEKPKTKKTKKSKKSIIVNVNIDGKTKKKRKKRTNKKTTNKTKSNVYNSTPPANIRPVIGYNHSLVSGNIDKNDAKEIEKIKNNIEKGGQIINELKNEIIELDTNINKEIRKRGRPKGSKNKPKNLSPKEDDKPIESIMKSRGRPKKESLISTLSPDTSEIIENITPLKPKKISDFSFNVNPESFFKPEEKEESILDLPPIPSYDDVYEKMKPSKKAPSEQNKPTKPLTMLEELKLKQANPNLKPVNKSKKPKQENTNENKPLSFIDELKLKQANPNLKPVIKFEDQNEEEEPLSEQQQLNDSNQKKKRGRPVGSKNKPKEQPTLMDQLKSAVLGRRSQIKDDDDTIASESNNVEWV